MELLISGAILFSVILGYLVGRNSHDRSREIELEIMLRTSLLRTQERLEKMQQLLDKISNDKHE